MNRVKRILSNKQILQRFIFTLALLLALRVMSFIPIPLVNVDAIRNLFENGLGFFAILNNFSGRSLERFSFLAMGISPYITASIVTQLLPMVVPTFKEWQEQGEEGRYKINKINRVLAIAIAFVQGISLVLSFSAGRGTQFFVGFSGNIGMAMIYIGLTIAAGTAICIWFADMITQKGIGNGSSMLITAGIIISIPSMFSMMTKKYITEATKWTHYVNFVVITLLYIAIILGVIFVETSSRKIPIQHANRQAQSDSNIPIKVNTGNVMPVIFASTLLGIPQTITGFITQNYSSGGGFWVNEIFNFQRPIGYIIYILLIIAFSFFYTFMQFDPEKISDNLSKSNAYIPGIRPGEDTKDFIAKTLFKVNVIGTIYLVIISSLPILTAVIFGLQGAEASAITLGGTSLLIVVGVAIETTKQIETDAESNQYRGIFG